MTTPALISVEEYRLAIERDPLAIGPRHQLASVYRCAGREADSIAQLESVLSMAPDLERLYIRLAYLYLATGRMEEGRKLFEQYADPEMPSIEFGDVYAMLGMADKAQALLDRAEANQRRWVDEIVALSLALGDKARALGNLEAVASDDPRWLVDVLCIRGISALAEEPQFLRLLRDAGFPEQAIQSIR